MVNAELGLAGVLWLLVAYRVWRHIVGVRGRKPVQVTGFLALQAAVMTFDSFPLADRFDAFLTPHASLLVQFICAVAAIALFVQMACEERDLPGQAQRHLRLTFLTIPLLVVGFSFAPVHYRTTKLFYWSDFTQTISEHGWSPFGWMLFFWGVYIGNLSHGIWLCIRYLQSSLREAATRRAALSFRLFIASCLLILLFFFLGAVVIVGRGLGYADSPAMTLLVFAMRNSETVGMMSLLLGAVTINTGISSTLGLVPVWLNLVRLRGLWLDMKQAVPTMQVGASQRRGIGRLFDARLRLYRRLIEIHDGYVTLAPWYPSDDAEVYGGGRAAFPADPVLRQAVSWELARRAKLRGEPATHQSAAPPSMDAQTLQEDIQQLRKAARLRRRAHQLADVVELHTPIAAAVATSHGGGLNGGRSADVLE